MEIEQLGDAPSPHGELLGEWRLKTKHYILDTVEDSYRSPRLNIIMEWFDRRIVVEGEKSSPRNTAQAL